MTASSPGLGVPRGLVLRAELIFSNEDPMPSLQNSEEVHKSQLRYKFPRYPCSYWRLSASAMGLRCLQVIVSSLTRRGVLLRNGRMSHHTKGRFEPVSGLKEAHIVVLHSFITHVESIISFRKS